jgi:outer membrane protein with beta-barrel domain
MKRWLILFTVGCVAFAGMASAAVQQGDTELEAQGTWMMQNSAGRPSTANDLPGIDIDALFVSAGIGYFLSDNLQVGAVAMGMWTSFDVEAVAGSSTDYQVDMYGIGAKAKYHFMPTNQWVPYVGGQVMWANADIDLDLAAGATSPWDGDIDGVLWGPILGLRYELNAYNDFFVEYQYHLWTGDIDELLDDGHGLFLGLVHQFK